jgi:hypothetical protein
MVIGQIPFVESESKQASLLVRISRAGNIVKCVGQREA